MAPASRYRPAGSLRRLAGVLPWRGGVLCWRTARSASLPVSFRGRLFRPGQSFCGRSLPSRPWCRPSVSTQEGRERPYWAQWRTGNGFGCVACRATQGGSVCRWQADLSAWPVAVVCEPATTCSPSGTWTGPAAGPATGSGNRPGNGSGPAASGREFGLGTGGCRPVRRGGGVERGRGGAAVAGRASGCRRPAAGSRRGRACLLGVRRRERARWERVRQRGLRYAMPQIDALHHRQFEHAVRDLMRRDGCPDAVQVGERVTTAPM